MTTHYLLDARTATAHFPGIGRYVRNLATAMVPLLSPAERLTILWDPSNPTAWDPSALAPRAQIVHAPVSPFSLSQQWRMPRILKDQFPNLPVSASLASIRRANRSPATRPAPLPNPQSPIPNPQSPIFHSAYYLMPYRPGVPTVLTIYDLIAIMHPEAVSLRARLLFRAATRLALAAAQEVIAISQATRTDLLAHFNVPAQRVTAIPLAADPRFTPQPLDEIERVRQAYQLPDRYLLYLGINKPHKNLPRLIEAYATLAQSPIPNPQSPIPLIIAGAWDERYPQARQAAQAMGLGERIRFLGRVDDGDLPALYSGCLGFVFPSLYEGCGLPVMEAMACGAAVACGDRSSLPEVAGDAALLFDPEDVGDMAQALHTLIHDEACRRSLAQASLLQARLFSWERTAAETLAVYRRVNQEFQS